MCDADRNEVVLESTLEHAASKIALANTNVKRLTAQVGRTYKDADERDRLTTFDFVAQGHSARMAIAVKPKRKLVSSGIQATVDAITEQHPTFADAIAVWTEDQLPRAEEHNAGWLLRSRRLRNEADIAVLRDLVEKTNGSVTVDLLIKQAPCAPARTFNAVLNLLDAGVIRPARRQRISTTMSVELAA